MTAHPVTIAPKVTQLTRDNQYNLYNFEAKSSFSHSYPREFSQTIIAHLKGAAPYERSGKRLFTASKGGEYSC
jgi:hypothetical protein